MSRCRPSEGRDGSARELATHLAARRGFTVHHEPVELKNTFNPREAERWLRARVSFAPRVPAARAHENLRVEGRAGYCDKEKRP